jgi:hypothetical protein
VKNKKIILINLYIILIYKKITIFKSDKY